MTKLIKLTVGIAAALALASGAALAAGKAKAGGNCVNKAAEGTGGTEKAAASAAAASRKLGLIKSFLPPALY